MGNDNQTEDHVAVAGIWNLLIGIGIVGTLIAVVALNAIF